MYRFSARGAINHTRIPFPIKLPGCLIFDYASRRRQLEIHIRLFCIQVIYNFLSFNQCPLIFDLIKSRQITINVCCCSSIVLFITKKKRWYSRMYEILCQNKSIFKQKFREELVNKCILQYILSEFEVVKAFKRL